MSKMATGTAGRILIVDDDQLCHLVMAEMLAVDNYELEFASSAEHALAVLAGQQPDLVLLDVLMPGIDGFELCRILKADETTRHIPVILVTGMGSEEYFSRGVEAGADEFITKPVRDVHLRARVRSMLRIKRQYDELLATLRMREDLGHMVVHDMRSPLHVLTLASELLLKRRDSLDAGTLKQVETIHSHSQLLGSFVNDLLMTAKLEGDRLVLSRQPEDLSALVLQLEASNRLVAESRGIELCFEPAQAPGTPISVNLDADLVIRLVENLLGNALKFSLQGSRVTVQLSSRTTDSGEAVVRLQVADQGPGIAPEHRERIFEKYEIVPLRRRGIRQFGLGLVFCKLVAEAHGGEIWVEPNQPQGAIFVLELPTGLAGSY